MNIHKSFRVAALVLIVAVFVFTPLLDARAGGNTQTIEGVVRKQIVCRPITIPLMSASPLNPDENRGPCPIHPLPIIPGSICSYEFSSDTHTVEVTPNTHVAVDIGPIYYVGASFCSSAGLDFTISSGPICDEIIVNSNNHFQTTCLAPDSGQLTFTVSGHGGEGAIHYTLTVGDIEIPEPPIPEMVDPEALAGLQRINQAAAIPYIIYVPTAARATEQNEIFIDLWHLDENGVGQPLLYISKDQLLALPDHPTENLLFASTPDSLVNVYKLTTGEYQLNIGPLAEGKVYTTIFDAIPPTQITNSTWIALP